MKILVFTDMHSSLKSFNKLEKKIIRKKPEAIVCAGDISIFENGLKILLQDFDRFKVPFYIIDGNHETRSNEKKICSKLKYCNFIHGVHKVQNDVVFLGYGGGGFAQVEPEFKKIGKKFSKIIKKNKDKKIIFISHGPPYKTRLDKIGKRDYSGSKTLRKFVEKNRVDYHICGHIHENERKKDKVNGTIVLNPGPNGRIIKV